MFRLLTVKEYLKEFYGRYESYILPIVKFLTALVTFVCINSRLGYMDKLSSISVVLVVSLFCSFLPFNFLILAGALFILLHLYALSLECAVVGLAVFLLMSLLYFRFTPADAVVVLLTPLCFALKIPYVIPLAMGLAGGPLSIISVSCGVVVHYILRYMSDSQTVTLALESEDTVARFQNVVDGLLRNPAMIAVIGTFAVTLLVVYVIRRLSIDYSWTIAMCAGAAADAVLLLFAEMRYDLQLSIAGILLGSVVSLGIAKVMQFFVLNLDYSRTEKVQFEDDEYYYYVKAVPKISISTPYKTIKKINTSKRGGPVRQAHTARTDRK